MTAKKPAPAKPTKAAAKAGSDDKHAKKAAVKPVPAKAPTKPAAKRVARVDVQQDATGFTITQPVRVSAEVRADYETAVRMLESRRWK